MLVGMFGTVGSMNLSSPFGVWMAFLSILISFILAFDIARKLEPSGGFRNMRYFVLLLAAISFYLLLRYRAPQERIVEIGAQIPKPMSAYRKNDPERLDPQKMSGKKHVPPKRSNLEINQTSFGPNSPNVIGNGNIINLAKPTYVLTDQQKAKISTAMRDFKGMEIVVRMVNHTSDTILFSSRLAEAFVNAGIVSGTGPLIESPPPPSPFYISANPNIPEHMRAARTLAKSLVEFGLTNPPVYIQATVSESMYIAVSPLPSIP
jgi:hypothetical protein